jgi:AraC family transcriptional activator of pobA
MVRQDERFAGGAVPAFRIYGEAEHFADPGFVHVESMAARGHELDWEIQPHRHDTFDQLVIVRSGRLTARIEGEAIALEGPVAVLIPASTVHGFTLTDGVDGHIITFSADLRAMLRQTCPGDAGLVDGAGAIALPAGRSAALAPLIDLLARECSGHEPGWTAAAGWLVGLILQQVGRIRSRPAEPGPSDRRERFRDLVDRHYREHRPVRFYAEAMGMTERSLSRLCQAAFQCSPTRYIHRRLLLEARRQLLFSGSTIAAIGEALGFADASYFNRFYRRMTGQAPSAGRGPAAETTSRSRGRRQ